MPISLQCTGCGKQYRLRQDLAGRRVKCGCGESMTIPCEAPGPHEIQEGNPGDDLLDESIWEAPAGSAVAEKPEPVEPERQVSRSPPVERPEPRAVNGGSAAGASVPANGGESTPQSQREKGTTQAAPWRIALPRRTLMANLAIGYGAAMTVYLVITLLIGGFRYYRFAHIALTATIAAGGVLLRKEHAQGSTVIGLGCAGVFLVSGVSDVVSLVLNLATIVTSIFVGWLPGQALFTLLSCAILLVKAVVVYPIPAYLIRWSLKEESKAREAEQRDDHFAIRDRISEEMKEARERERLGR